MTACVTAGCLIWQKTKQANKAKSSIKGYIGVILGHYYIYIFLASTLLFTVYSPYNGESNGKEHGT